MKAKKPKGVRRAQSRKEVSIRGEIDCLVRCAAHCDARVVSPPAGVLFDEGRRHLGAGPRRQPGAVSGARRGSVGYPTEAILRVMREMGRA